MLFAILMICGLLIGAAIYLFIRSIRNISKGKCCEGCAGCKLAETCPSRTDADSAQQKTERG